MVKPIAFDGPTQYKQPLYDTEHGGGAKAWICLIPVDTDDYIPQVHSCGKITRTLKGMTMHHKRVHNFEEQGQLYDGTN